MELSEPAKRGLHKIIGRVSKTYLDTIGLTAEERHAVIGLYFDCRIDDEIKPAACPMAPSRENADGLLNAPYLPNDD